MKIKCCLVVCLLMMCLVSLEAESEDLTPNASSSVLMDYDSGEILYEKNSHEQLYPASMTKMMSLYLVLKAIHQGSFDWDDIVVASDHAASLGGSQIYLEAGERMSVLDLFKASSVASANDAITALAEKVSGTESSFVSLMNETASSFGCKNTYFVNPTGLHDPKHVSSAYDMALIAYHLIQEGGNELLQYTSLLEDYIREDSEQKFWLVNTNKMLRSYPGMDGLKTGYTSQSMYCITVTAMRDGLRLIGVVMHEPDKNSRNKDVSALLDYGFANYRYHEMFKKNEINESIRIEKGIPEIISITNESAAGFTSSLHENVTEVSRSITMTDTHAPIYENQVVGTMHILLSNGKMIETNLIAKENSDEMSFWNILKDCVMNVLF